MVQSVTRSLLLLDALSKSHKKCSLAELCEITALAPSTVHRLLLALKESRFVAQDSSSSKYYLGPALIILGIRASNYLNLRELARPVLTSLAATSKEDAYLSLIDGDNAIMAESAYGPQPLKVIYPLTVPIPLHSGAARKVLLAYQDPAFIEKYLHKKLSKYTNNTTTDANKLRVQLEEIREKGYSITLGESLNGALGICSPVFDSFGNIVAGLGISCPTLRIKKEDYPALIELVKQHAKQLSSDLGYVDAK